MKWLGWHFVLCVGFISPAAKAETRRYSHDVVSESGLTCRVHLWLPDDYDSHSLTLFAYGTGAFSVEEGMNPVGEAVLKDKLSAVLSFEKPGIQFQDAKTKVDRDIYARHRPKDLVECAREALRWADGKVSARKIVLSGHSAGAETVLDLIENLRDRRDPLAAKIAQVHLYGPPLEAWPDLVKKQMARMSEVRRRDFTDAFERRDEDFFLAPENGAIPLGYFDTVFASPSLASRLKQSVSTLPETFIFQGRSDARCEVGAVHCLESELPESANPNLHFRYFEQGHAYEPDSVTEMVAVLRRALLE